MIAVYIYVAFLLKYQTLKEPIICSYSIKKTLICLQIAD